MATKEVKILIKAQDDASRKFKDLNKTIGAVGTTIATAFAVGKGANMVRDTINAADAIGKGAKRIQVTTDQYQKLAHASELAGASQFVVESAFKRMSAVIRDAERGLKDSQDTITDLGLTLEQLSGKNTYEQFNLIAEAVNNSNDKLALAQKIFGRAGQQLLPFVENFKEAGKELENMGTMLDSKTIAAAERFNDSMTKLNTNITAAISSSGIIEWLDDVADRFVTVQNAAGGFKWNMIAAIEDIIPGVAMVRKALHGETANETLQRLQQARLDKINRDTIKSQQNISSPDDEKRRLNLIHDENMAELQKTIQFLKDEERKALIDNIVSSTDKLPGDWERRPRNDFSSGPSIANPGNNALQAFVTRGLSGLSESGGEQAMRKTEKNTQETAKQLTNANSYLSLIAQRLQNAGGTVATI